MAKKNRFPIIMFVLLILPLTIGLYFFNKAEYSPKDLEFSMPSALAAAETQQSNRARIDLVYKGKIFSYNDDIIEPTDHLVAEEIHRRKINAPFEEKLRMVDKAISMGAGTKEAMLYAFPLLEKTVDAARKFVDSDPIESTIKFNPDKNPMFAITRDKVGYKLIDERLYRDIFKSLMRSRSARVSIVPQVLNARTTYAENRKMTKLRASFSTDYAHSNENRKHNIRLALKRINGTVLKPGEEFSFNKIVGKRSEANGFRTAKIILNGEYTEGVGGGVCQASTAVYNCALRADMDITSVRSHSLVSGYVEPSFDAMVNASSSDLKFRNGGKGSVFVRAVAGENSAKIEFYGIALEYRIACESVVISKSDPPPEKIIIDNDYKYLPASAAPGEKMRVSYGHGALKSEGYLLYYNSSGKLLKRKLIRKDSYSSVQGIVAVAPGEPEPIMPPSVDSGGYNPDEP